MDDYDTDGDIHEEEDDVLICDEVGGDNNDTALDEDNMRNEDVAFVGNDHDVDFGSDDQLIRGENDEKNNLISPRNDYVMSLVLPYVRSQRRWRRSYHLNLATAFI